MRLDSTRAGLTANQGNNDNNSDFDANEVDQNMISKGIDPTAKSFGDYLNAFCQGSPPGAGFLLNDMVIRAIHGDTAPLWP
jgi:hypothetical protein